MTLKAKGFFMIEAVTGFMIACLTITLLALTLGEGKQMEKRIEGRVDRALAYYIFKKTDKQQVYLHDHLYQKASGKAVYDVKTGKVYEVE